jgi:phosphatidylglycerol lysyltransferase
MLVATAGAVTLAQVLTITVHHHRFGRIDDSLLPFTAAQNSRLFVLGMGLLLIYLSTQIYRRKLLAYQLVSIGLAGLIGVEIFLSKNIIQLLFYVVTLGLLLLTRSHYTVAANNFSLRRGAAISGLIILVVFIYASIGFSRLSAHEVGHSLAVSESMKYAAREIFTFQESQLPLRTRNARLFVVSVNTAAAMAYSLTMVSLFRPLQFQYGASRRERALARSILEKYSTSTEDYFKLWPPDKHYFFSSNHESFVAYKVIGSDALALGDPSGPPAALPKLARDFEAFCQSNGWSAAYINATGHMESVSAANEYQRLFIGNEAVIDIAAFVETTQRSKHFRYIRNRAERDGISFEYWPAPLTTGQIARLRSVSNAWLGSRSRREYTFAMGYFDIEYVKGCDAGVLITNGRVVAYTNVIPGLKGPSRSIDHMRYRSDMPPTGMHYLLMQLILHFHEAGVQSFNLGLAPLSGLEDREDSNLPERLLGALKKLGGNYYSFEGLEQFKNKFEPRWQPRYIYYQGSPARLLKLARNLTRAVGVPIAGRARRITIISLSIIAAICYASFPLAIIFNPDKIFSGLASELGQSGARYAALFNGLDILSSLLIFTVIWLLWNKAETRTERSRQILILLGLSALGNMLAAVTPLPRSIHPDTQFVLHDIFSTLNIFALVGAAGLTVAIAGTKRWLGALWALLAVALVASAMFEGRIVGTTAQRVQIILTGLWIIVISYSLSRQNQRH